MSRYVHDEKIDMEFLLRDFQEFWRANAQIWDGKYDYDEGTLHFTLLAFLQRIISDDVKLNHDMELGTGKLDFCIFYGKRRYPIVLKILQNEHSYTKGLEMIAKYIDMFACREGWLIVFDRREDISLDDKIFVRHNFFENKKITIFGC
ncbi:MAG: hypothetical protein LBQ66_06225 [Planctomycetaceae bacterium]|jgi:hypothetical protein|nr:hypothetical protein [Planctomycetaceae bacterium]